MRWRRWNEGHSDYLWSLLSSDMVNSTSQYFSILRHGVHYVTILYYPPIWWTLHHNTWLSSDTVYTASQYFGTLTCPPHHCVTILLLCSGIISGDNTFPNLKHNFWSQYLSFPPSQCILLGQNTFLSSEAQYLFTPILLHVRYLVIHPTPCININCVLTSTWLFINSVEHWGITRHRKGVYLQRERH